MEEIVEINDFLGGAKLSGFSNIEEVTDRLRKLRNACALGGADTQNFVMDHPELMGRLVDLLSSCLPRGSYRSTTVCIQVVVQVFGNVIVRNERNKQLFWERYLDDLKPFLSFDSSKVNDLSCMVVLNLIIDSPERRDAFVKSDLLVKVLLCAVDGCAFACYIAENLIQSGHFLQLYNNDNTKVRLYCLELLLGSVPTLYQNLTEEEVSYLVIRFKLMSKSILRTSADQVDSFEPAETSKLLHVLCMVSGYQRIQKIMQKDRSLLVDACFLLRSVHSAVKDSSSPFALVDSVPAARPDLADKPTFAFKSDLVRLMSNLVCQNPDNQDLVREADCIPVLLDCCRIDANNPLILEWCIVTLKYLLDRNVKNQQIIKEMKSLGLVDPSTLAQIHV